MATEVLARAGASSFMLPPPAPSVNLKQRQSRLYSKEEWDAHQSDIARLYDVEKRPLKEVVNILWRTRGFFATERQYKRRIKEWHLDKNVKTTEMRAIVRKQRIRSINNKKSLFRVRGRPLQPDHIHRWLKQHENLDIGIESPSRSRADTPSDISCYTPCESRASTPKPKSGNTKATVAENSTTPLRASSPAIIEPFLNGKPYLSEHQNTPCLQENPTSDWDLSFSDEMLVEQSSPSKSSSPESSAGTDVVMTRHDKSCNPERFSVSICPRLDPSQVEMMADTWHTKNAEMTLHEPITKENQERVYRNRLSELDRIFGPKHPATIDTLIRLATAVGLQGRYDAALPLIEQAVSSSQEVFGDKSPTTLEAKSKLVFLLKVSGKLSTAETLGRSLYKSTRAILGMEHLLTMFVTTNFAGILTDVCKFAEAEIMQWDLMHRQIRVLGLEHRMTVITMRTLAATLMKQNKSDECSKLCSTLSSVVERATSLDQYEVMNTKDQLACAAGHVERYETAETLQREVFKQRKMVQGLTHPATLCTLANLAETLRQRARVAGNLSQMNPLRLSLQRQIVKHGEKLQRLEESKLYCQIVSNGLESILGLEHPETLLSLAASARTLIDLGEVEEAEGLATRALTGQEQILGANHYQTMRSAFLLARCFDLQNHFQEADPLYQRALAGLSLMKGEKSSEVGEVWLTYFSMLEKMDPRELLHSLV